MGEILCVGGLIVMHAAACCLLLLHSVVVKDFAHADLLCCAVDVHSNIPLSLLVMLHNMGALCGCGCEGGGGWGGFCGS